jgi:DNA-binding XRE family transcriptional regulator
VERTERNAFYVHFGQAVRQARLRRALTQSDVGEVLHLTRASVANIEAGRQQCTLQTAVTIAEMLGVPLGQLLPVPDDTATPDNRLLESVPPRLRKDVMLVLNRSRDVAAPLDDTA